MENKVVKYECRGCKKHLERQEFHYSNFEKTIPRKMCWDCEKQEAISIAVRDVKQNGRDLLNEYKNLKTKYTRLEKVNNIKIPIKANKIPKYKHHSLNVYMEEGNVNDAWMLHKGEFRKYRTYPNQYQEGDSVFVYKRPDGTNKYYGLMNMHQWIMEKKENVESPF